MGAFCLFSTAPSCPIGFPLPLHDALPISSQRSSFRSRTRPASVLAPTSVGLRDTAAAGNVRERDPRAARSEEHTSELQSHSELVCRLLPATKILRALIDPNTAPLRALPRDDRDLFIAATNGRVLPFFNCSFLPHWIPSSPTRRSSDLQPAILIPLANEAGVGARADVSRSSGHSRCRERT